MTPHPSRPAHRLPRVALALAGGLALLLAGCAPSAADTVAVQQTPNTVAYYPHQAGVARTYLPQGAAVDAPNVTITELGPTSLNDQLLFAERRYGRGDDTTIYRAFTAQGVFITQEDRPAYTLTYDPPLQQFPSPDTLQVGASWGGTTTATFSFSASAQRSSSTTIHYHYLVVQRRKVTVNHATLDVFVIDRSATDPQHPKDSVHQELWFAPHLGLVKTPEDLYLIHSNIPLPPKG